MNALIGYTGFVGGHLQEQGHFDEFYNSSNIDDIRGRSFDLLACAGTTSLMWQANARPDEDWRAIERLIDCLGTVSARRVAFISTIAVYPEPVGVDERAPIETTRQTPYGNHRYRLERFVCERFNTTVLRLPNLFGRGLKKNVLFDLLNRHQLEKIHADATYQYYNLAHLGSDIDHVAAHNIPLINVATEPVSVAELASQALDMAFDNRPAAIRPNTYDFRSVYASHWGQPGPYLYSKQHVLDEVRRFAEVYRAPALKLAASAIGWTGAEDESVRSVLADAGISGVELVPDRFIDESGAIDLSRAEACRRFWEAAGIEPIALQGVLFGHEHLRLFDSDGERDAMKRQCECAIAAAQVLGAPVIVFGAPRNRQRHGLSPDQAEEIAVPFFRDLACTAFARGVTVCVEHLPPDYDTDYINTPLEAAALARKVNHPGFGINLDTGALVLGGDAAADTILSCRPYIRHAHISRPLLGPVEDLDPAQHAAFAARLRQSHYDGWISIEMKRRIGGNVEGVRRSVDRVRSLYT